VNVRSTSSGLSSNARTDLHKAVDDLFDLYSLEGGFTKEGLLNIVNKHKDKIQNVLSGMPLPVEDLIDMLLSMDTNQNGALSPEEIEAGLRKLVPAYNWVESTEPATRAHVFEMVKKDFPDASDEAVNSFTETFMRLDESWNAGNADGKIARSEVASAGFLLGFAQQVKLPFKPTAGKDTAALLTAQIQNKLNQQVFARYSATAFNLLPLADQRLEWMRLILRFYFSDKLANYSGKDITPALTTFLKYSGVTSPMLQKLYKSKLMGGRGTATLSTLEFFNLATDMEYAGKIVGRHSKLDAATITNDPSLLLSMLQVFPRSGVSVFTEKTNQARADYWNKLSQFDAPALGGNKNGLVDTYEVTLALGYVRVIDNLYLSYDTNSDGWITKEEARPFFAELGFDQDMIVDAFFAGIDLSDADPISIALKLLLSGNKGINRLLPYEFYNRTFKLFPKLLDPSQKPQQIEEVLKTD
jgi:antitoxin component of RelBE/YafQ-DinJ toxin-antitoxin module